MGFLQKKKNRLGNSSIGDRLNNEPRHWLNSNKNSSPSFSLQNDTPNLPTENALPLIAFHITCQFRYKLARLQSSIMLNTRRNFFPLLVCTEGKIARLNRLYSVMFSWRTRCKCKQTVNL